MEYIKTLWFLWPVMAIPMIFLLGALLSYGLWSPFEWRWQKFAGVLGILAVAWINLFSFEAAMEEVYPRSLDFLKGMFVLTCMIFQILAGWAGWYLRRDSSPRQRKHPLL